MKTDFEICSDNELYELFVELYIVKGEYSQEEKPWDGVLKTIFDFYVNLPSSGP